MASGRVPNTTRILRTVHHALHDLVEARGYRRPPVVFLDKLARGPAQLRPAQRIAQELHHLTGEIGWIVGQHDVIEQLLVALFDHVSEAEGLEEYLRPVLTAPRVALTS